jgi:hypothetical protein
MKPSPAAPPAWPCPLWLRWPFWHGTPAHAVGRLTDINVIDRDSGADPACLPPPGRTLGRRTPRRALRRLRAQCQRRARARRDLGGRRQRRIGGNRLVGADRLCALALAILRTSLAGARATPRLRPSISPPRQASYAARTGRPDHVGVIGVAVFREKLPPPPPVSVPYSPPGGRMPECQRIAAVGPGAARRWPDRRPSRPRLPRRLPLLPPNPGPKVRKPPARAAVTTGLHRGGACGCGTRAWARAMASARARCVSPHLVRAPKPTGPTS